MQTFSSSKRSVEIFKSSHPCRRCFTFMISILSNLRIVSFETKDLIGWKREQIRNRFVKKKKLGHLWKKIQNGNHSHDQLLPACENTLWRNNRQIIGCFRSSQYNVWWWIALLRIIESCWKTFSPWKLIGLFQLQLCLVSPQFCLLSASLKFVINLVHWNVLVSPWKPSWSEWRGCQQSV